MRRRLASYHVTALGWILLVLVPALVLVGVFGPHGVALPSFIAALVLALLVVGGSFSSGRGVGSNLEAVQRAGAEFEPRKGPQPIEQETYDPEAWRRERERRESVERGEGPAL